MNYEYLTIVVLLILILIETSIALSKITEKQNKSKSTDIYIDTSALMDGRIAEMVESGFILGDIVITQSVVREMQFLADGSDNQKRSRARHGIDVAKKLRNSDKVSVRVLQDLNKQDKKIEVDEHLITLAKENGGVLMTVDYNLNKVAQFEGISVLNINELARSLRSEYIPGEKLEVKIIQKGQESNQGVGYTNDGIMVVVDNAQSKMNQIVKTELVRVIQTDAGRMVFARLDQDSKSKKSSKDIDKKENIAKKTVKSKIKSFSRNYNKDKKQDDNKSSKEKNRKYKPKNKSPEDSIIDLAKKQG